MRDGGGGGGDEGGGYGRGREKRAVIVKEDTSEGLDASLSRRASALWRRIRLSEEDIPFSQRDALARCTEARPLRDGAGAVVAAGAGVLVVDRDVGDGLRGGDGGGDGEERVHCGAEVVMEGGNGSGGGGVHAGAGGRLLRCSSLLFVSRYLCGTGRTLHTAHARRVAPARATRVRVSAERSARRRVMQTVSVD